MSPGIDDVSTKSWVYLFRPEGAISMPEIMGSFINCAEFKPKACKKEKYIMTVERGRYCF